jgi:asparagine synthase (glutamine-hydrolysing)
MQKYIPNEIINAEKQGFSAPDASWFKGQSIDYVRETLYNKNSVIYNYLDYKSIVELTDEHLNGVNNRRLFIWSLLNFEHWCKKFI